jgi:hypothetical protein
MLIKRISNDVQPSSKSSATILCRWSLLLLYPKTRENLLNRARKTEQPVSVLLRHSTVYRTAVTAVHHLPGLLSSPQPGQ